jgi:hypothetical protein
MLSFGATIRDAGMVSRLTLPVCSPAYCRTQKEIDLRRPHLEERQDAHEALQLGRDVPVGHEKRESLSLSLFSILLSLERLPMAYAVLWAGSNL